MTKVRQGSGASSPHLARLTGRFGICAQASVLVAACAVIASPVFARTPYDGAWSVVIMTRAGACEPSFRYGVDISNGAVINSGGAVATVEGRVTPRGAVKVTVRSGNEWAVGSGRLGRYSGGGKWRGQGSSGNCAGTWSAARRAPAGVAQEGNAPIYNYVRNERRRNERRRNASPERLRMLPPASRGSTHTIRPHGHISATTAHVIRAAERMPTKRVLIKRS